MIKFKFLSENKTDNPGCMAEHGLSIYIETAEKKLLFDTGASDLLIHNAKRLYVDLSMVEHVIISHGHYDHTEGIPAFCRINSMADIFIHKNSFGENYGMENGVMDKEPCGILWTEKVKKQFEHRFNLTDKVTKITEDIVISGTIPDYQGCIMPEKFFLKQKDGTFIEDDMSHEQFLIVRDRDSEGNSKGIFVFSGCSHKGVIPVLKYSKELFPEEKVACIVAGMHLYNAVSEVRKKVVDEIVEASINEVMPVHCTGIKAICDLKARLGERCIVATAGDRFIR